MLILDDIVAAPFKGFIWIIRKIQEAAQEELESEAENIKAQLSELYRKLERGEITESEFDERESKLLDRLDQIDEYLGSGDKAE